MKKIFKEILLIVISVLLIFTILGSFGCSGSRIDGLYVAGDDSDLFLKLEKDGTWTTLLWFGGTWQVDGNELTLRVTDDGILLMAETMKIEGNKLIDSTSRVFIKKED